MNGQRINRSIIRSSFEKISRMYESQKVLQKNVVFLICDNTLEAISLYCYHLVHKNIVFLIGREKGDRDIIDLIDNFAPEEIFLCPGRFRHEEQVRELKSRNYRRVSGYHQYTRYQRRYNDVWSNLDDNTALLITTSGSVGNGKVVALSYDNLRKNAEAIIQSLEIDHHDMAGLLLPISYVYGLSVVNSHLLADAEILLPPGNIFQASYWNYLEEMKVSSFCGVPYTYEIIRRLKVLERPWRHLRLLTQAGGAMNLELKRFLLEWVNDRTRNGILTHLAVMYGQTEATARMSSFYLDQHPDKIKSVGKAISGGRFWIHNSSDDGQGNIYYYGPNVFMGYVNKREDLEKSPICYKCDKKELDTGDIGWLDEDGYLYVTGRKKRFIKINGVRIGLDELEQEIENRWKVKTVCVKTRSKEYLIMYLIEDITEPVREEIMTYLRLLGLTRKQYRLQIVKSFYYRENGKIDYGKFGMEEEYEDDL